nr:hypothetical protein Iba_chr13bCG4310 [Ipomoea batatas]GMD77691.1 hypothetical protein Iba_chr13cCG5790 [Ipomoea batatas]GMD80857.1 hypothetical protein Iba_chr13eCG5940 [Ipomoea batatas]GMD81884.1 hypothetical protein Iba_chr13fCG2700 [Ipomoea batatas]GME01163.1 hypothetical protein Iba_contig1104CG0010 [Ipomoea batatas]
MDQLNMAGIPDIGTGMTGEETMIIVRRSWKGTAMSPRIRSNLLQRERTVMRSLQVLNLLKIWIIEAKAYTMKLGVMN